MGSFAESTSRYTSGQSKEFLTKRGTLTISSEGAVVGDIPASLFGMVTLTDVSLGIKSDDSIVQLFVISADGTSLLAIDIEDATDADRGDPADATGDFVITITGS